MNKSSSSRFGSFFSRVQTEREVLGIVNSTFGHHAFLHGLTEVAINQWETRLMDAGVLVDVSVSDALSILHRISIRSDTLADQSRVVFDDEAPAHKLPIADLVDQLRGTCTLREQSDLCVK